MAIKQVNVVSEAPTQNAALVTNLNVTSGSDYLVKLQVAKGAATTGNIDFGETFASITMNAAEYASLRQIIQGSGRCRLSITHQILVGSVAVVSATAVAPLL